MALKDSSIYREVAKKISQEADALQELLFSVKNIGEDHGQWDTGRSKKFRDQKVQLHSDITAKHHELKQYASELLRKAEQIDAENSAREKV